MIKKTIKMVDRQVVFSNCLCFLINKINKIALKPLKSLMLDFYSPLEILEAKNIFLLDIDHLNLEKFPKISLHKRDSLNKNVDELDDIVSAITFMDKKIVRKSVNFCGTIV